MDTTFTTHVTFSSDTIARGDSIRTFVVHAKHIASLAQPLTLRTIPALGINPGDVLDAAFRDSVLAQFWPLVSADSLSQPIPSTVTWDYLDLPMDYATDACMDTVPMYISMSYVDECDNLLRDTFEVVYRQRLPVVHVVTETELNACEGELVVDTRYGGFTPFVMPDHDTIFTTQVQYDVTTTCGDSVRHYLVSLRQPVYEEVETQTICTEQTYYWRGHALTAKGTYHDTAFYTSGCDSVIYTLELDVREDYFSVNDDYVNGADIHIPAYLKYGNSMLMLDLRELNKNLLAAGREMLSDSSMVAWYRVRGEADMIDITGSLVSRETDSEPDELLGYGFYMPVPASVSAVYYACVRMDNLQGVCGVVYRSQQISSLLDGTVTLSPSRAPKGTRVRVDGCDNKDCTIRVYSMLGALMMTESFAPGTACEFTAPGIDSGCYIVEVRTSESCTTHRLVIE